MNVTRWLLLCAALVSPLMVVAAEDDTWVGQYRTTWMQGLPGTDGKVSIARAPDAAPATAVGNPDADLARWFVSSPGKNQVIQLRRFLPGEYEGLDAAAPTECLNGNSVALCHVKPGTTVSFDGGGAVPEKFVARTGYFGVFIRNGTAVFELTKLSSTP